MELSAVMFFNVCTIQCLQRRQWQPTPVLLPGKSHGRRSLVGCSPWGWTRLSNFTFTFHFHALGKKNSNPLQYSCPENPRDGGAWWAAVYGVTQSWIRLSDLAAAAAEALSA